MNTASHPGSVIRLTPPCQAVTATIPVPGSKSYTIRALLLAALANKTDGQPVKIQNPLHSDDTLAMKACLQALGLCITDVSGVEKSSDWLISGAINPNHQAETILNANLSAATLRFLIALCTVISGTQTLLGNEGLNRRPVRDLVDSLRTLGAQIEYLDIEGYPPVRITSGQLQAERIVVSGTTSSQYISALLMIAPLITTTGPTLTIEVPEAPISRPYLDMTLAIMQDFGVSAQAQKQHQQFIIPTQQHYHCVSYTIEPDASGMAYFLAMAALSNSTVTIPNVNPHSTQADMRLVEILQQMGNTVSWQSNSLTLKGTGVQPISINMEDCPDQAQTVAVLVAFANGTSRLEGLQSLRVKETDRLHAVTQELQKMGVVVEEEASALTIHGGSPNPARIATYGDHRMAMAFAVAGTRLSGLEIEDPEVVNKTYPDFWRHAQAMGLEIQHIPTALAGKRIVLIGFMGAGKSTIAQHLAQRFKWPVIDLDTHILATSSRRSIVEIFEQDGEAHFRALEYQAAQSIHPDQKAIIATGAGVVSQPGTLEALRENAIVIFLDTPLETIQNRLEGDMTRPLGQNPEKVQALYTQRLPLYQQHAHVILDTQDKSPSEISDILWQKLQALNHDSVCPPTRAFLPDEPSVRQTVIMK